jgi:hypothetical protein
MRFEPESGRVAANPSEADRTIAPSRATDSVVLELASSQEAVRLGTDPETIQRAALCYLMTNGFTPEIDRAVTGDLSVHAPLVILNAMTCDACRPTNRPLVTFNVMVA